MSRTLFALALLWGLTVTLLGVAYQTRQPMTLHVGGDDWLYDNGYLAGFLPASVTKDARFRFTDGNARVQLFALGQTSPLELSVRLNAWRPEGVREVTLTLNHTLLRRVSNGEWRNHRVVITDTTQLSPNQFVLDIQSDTFVPNEYDANNPNTRAQGVAVEWLTLTPRLATDVVWWKNFTQPAWEWIVFVGIVASGAYWMGVRVRAARVGFLLGLGIILFAAFVTAIARLALPAYVLPLLGAWLILSLFLVQVRAQALAVGERKWLWLLLVLGVVCFAWATRLFAATHLPLSGDEQIYVPVSAHYADAFTRGAWGEILTSRENTEHPLFVKLAFALAIGLGKFFSSASQVFDARVVSLAASTLLTALLALINPFAAAALAMHSIQIHYASQAYLEAVPALTITLTMFCFERAAQRGTRWLWFSAIFLGLTAASKYIYAVGGFALMPFLIWRYRRKPQIIFLYGLVAVLFFFIADPFLWTNPLGNLVETLSFHRRVSTSELVNAYARPFYWHLIYLTRLAEWEAGFPYFSFDTLIFVGGILGLPALWRHSRLYFIWFSVALLFLFLWNTKWEQYALTLITPLCLAFGFGLSDAARTLAHFLERRNISKRVEA